MKKSKQWLWVGAMILGFSLAAAGLYLCRAAEESQGAMAVLPFVMIGFGCGMFGGALGELVSAAAIKKHPDLIRQMEIQVQDERNVLINSRAKAKAYDAMVYIFGALLVAFGLMGVALAPLLLLVAAYLIVVGWYIYWVTRYHKEM